MHSAVITGATGFLGRHLTSCLAENGVKVYAIVRPDSANTEIISGIGNVEIIKCPLADLEKIASEIEKCDAFYHLAWGGVASKERGDIAQYSNIYDTLCVLRAANKNGAGVFIGTGSQAEYGIAHEMLSEDSTPLSPVTHYGAAKAAALSAIKIEAEKLSQRWIWARVISCYGPGDSSATLLSYISKCFNNRVTAELSRCGQLWNFLHVRDAAGLFYEMGKTKCKSGAYHVANTESKPLSEMLTDAVKASGLDLNIVFGDKDGNVSLNVNMQKTLDAFAWRPKIGFNEGFADFIKHSKLT